MIEHSEDDALSLRIGRIARAHVDLDIALRWVFSTLSSPGLANYLTNNQSSTSRLIEDVGIMVEKGVEHDRLKQAARATLHAARTAGEARNRAVHDWWVPEFTEFVVDGEQPSPGTHWSGWRPARGQLGFTRNPDEKRELSWMDDTLVLIQRARIRTSAMGSGLRDVLPFFQGALVDVPSRETDFELALRAMEDRFDLLPGGAFRVHDNLE